MQLQIKTVYYYTQGNDCFVTNSKTTGNTTNNLSSPVRKPIKRWIPFKNTRISFSFSLSPVIVLLSNEQNSFLMAT